MRQANASYEGVIVVRGWDVEGCEFFLGSGGNREEGSFTYGD